MDLLAARWRKPDNENSLDEARNAARLDLQLNPG